jgi:hypothetical protein
MSMFANLFGMQGDGAAQVAAAKASATPAQGAPSAGDPAAQAPANTAPPAPPKSLDDVWQLMQQSASGKEPAGKDGPASLDLIALAQNKDAIANVAKSRDFLSQVPQELLQQAQSGDANAFIQLIQAASQAAYAQGLQDTTLLAGRGIASQQDSLPNAVQKQLTQHMHKQALEAAIPADAHPAAGVFLTSVAKDLQAVSPQLSASDAMQLAQGMLRDMTQSFDGKAKAAKAAKADANWDKWFLSDREGNQK